MLGAIRDRLLAELPMPPYAGVEVAEDIDALKDRAGMCESATVIVMPWREQAGEQPLMSGGFRQRVLTEFATGLVIRHYDDPLGGDRAIQFDALKAGIEAALAAWEPPGAEPCELVGGEGSPVARGVSIYVQTWATARFLTGA